MGKTSIAEFVNATIKEIESGLMSGYELDEVVEFEVSIITKRQSDGQLNLSLVTGSTSNHNETVQKVTFSVINAKQRQANLKTENEEMMNTISNGIKAIQRLGQKSSTTKKTQH